MKTKLDKSLKKDLIETTKSNEVDFTKKYNNGHQFYDSQQSTAHKEMLKTESRVSTNFEKSKHVLIKPRNPINGDPTPRDVKGDAILNPNLHGKALGGTLLFPESEQFEPRESLSRFSSRRPTEKIGVDEGKYDILGRTGESLANSLSSKSLFTACKEFHSKKLEVVQEKETLHAMIMKQKAKRHEKELNRQLAFLEQQSSEKLRELEYLKNTYKLDD